MKALSIFSALFFISALMMSSSAMAQQYSGQQQGQQFQNQQDTQVDFSAPDLAQIQMRLAQAGFYQGNIDGVWGENTKQALRQYQQAVGIQPTGDLNLRTLASLTPSQQQQFYGQAPAFQQQPRSQQYQQPQFQPQTQYQPQFQPQTQYQQPQFQHPQFQQQGQQQETQVTFNSSDLRNIQQRLSQLGFYHGNIDGIWGESTAQAVRQYQQARGMQPTGNLNLTTLAALSLVPQQFYGQAPAFQQQPQGQQFQRQPKGQFQQGQ